MCIVNDDDGESDGIFYMKALSKILRFVKSMSGIWIELLENVREDK